MESVTVFQDYGVQISHFNGYVVLPRRWNEKWFSKIVFYPRDKIVDVIINEGFEGSSVVFYLCLIVKGASKLTLLFPRTKPRLVDQKLIYQMLKREGV